MQSIVETYNTQLQKHLSYINSVAAACQSRCEDLRKEADARIAALTAPNEEEETKIKIKLKKQLDQLITEFEREMRNKFINNLFALEHIYREKEVLELQKIETKISTL
jgi:F0F1-type ATP synthase delta subunit